MENILQLNDAIGSLIDIVPEPKKAKRKNHKIALLYDTKNSDVGSAWAESADAIANAYRVLLVNESVVSHSLQKNYMKRFENFIDLQKSPSIEDLVTLVNDVENSFDLCSLRDLKKVETFDDRK